MYYFYKGAPDLSEECYNESMAISKELGEKLILLSTLCNLGSLLLYKGEADRATAVLEQGLELCGEFDAIFSKARILQNLAGVYHQKGIYDKALEYYEEALILSDEIGDKNANSVIHLNLGNLYFIKNDFLKAEEFFSKGMAIAKTFNYSLALNHFAIKLGDLALINNEKEKAKEIYWECLKKFYEDSDVRKMASCIFGLSCYFLAENQFEKSAQFYALSEKLYYESKFKISTSLQEKFQKVKSDLLLTMSNERFEELYEKGKETEIGDVVKEAEEMLT
jgi:tetratricopeptide (TPR) repeat protein